jgi:hypothetical protein
MSLFNNSVGEGTSDWIYQNNKNEKKRKNGAARHQAADMLTFMSHSQSDGHAIFA